MCLIPDNGACRMEPGARCPICTTPEDQRGREQMLTAADTHPPLMALGVQGSEAEWLRARQQASIDKAADRLLRYYPELNPHQARVATMLTIDIYLREMRKIKE